MEQKYNNPIDIERVKNVDDYEIIICSICNKVYIHPVRCANCDYHFCKNCIENYLVYNPGKCPRCIFFVMKHPSPVQNKALSRLEIHCFYYPNCTEILQYDFLLKHEEKCIFNGIL